MPIPQMNTSDRNKIKSSLLTVLCNATGIYRKTIPAKHKAQYKVKLKQLILRLTMEIDANFITNHSIRKAIIALEEYCGSIGASQKAINVYLKFYAVICNKRDAVLVQLDCPIDRWVIERNRFKRTTLNKLNLEAYEEMQDILQKKYGMRILADVDAWDSRKQY
jgi:hypothetical protein